MGNISQDSFDRYLSMLDPDRERAGAKYEQIRERLVSFFALKGCASPEDLADETISRVLRKVQGIARGDNVNLYVYNVARHLLREYHRRAGPLHELSNLEQRPEREDEDVENQYRCLEKCMARLSSNAREMIVTYYEGGRSSKLDHRMKLAQEFGMSESSLTLQIHRILMRLEKCITNCVEADRQTYLGNSVVKER